MNRNAKLIGVFLILAYFAKIVLVPIFLAVFLAMLLEPAVKFLARYNLSRTLVTTFVILVAGAALTFIGWLAYTASIEMAVALPVYVAKINFALERLTQLSHDFNRGLGGAAAAPQLSSPYAMQWEHFFFSSLGTIYEALSILIFVPLLMFYFLSDKQNLLESFNVISGRYFNLPKLNMELPRMLRVFFAANMVTGIFLVIAHGILTLAAGYENWVSLAVLTAFLNLLPVVGGVASIAAMVLLGIGVKITVGLILSVGLVVFGLHFLANNLIVPMVVGSRININAVTLIIGIMFWSWMWGVAGFILAVPMTALIKILLECNRETVVFANLMAAKPKRVLGNLTEPANALN